MKFARVLLAAMVLPVCAALALPAAAQSYPSRPIKLIVPFGPGSGSDTLGRVVAERLSEQLKQPVVVENREGAGGVIGTQVAAKSPADGYTLVLVSNAVTIAPHLQATPPFDAVKDFAPVSKIAFIPLAVISSSTLPFTTLPEMVAWLKANPGKSNYASSGKGSQSHLEAAQLMAHYGVTKIEDVPYKSVGQAMTDTLVGQVAFYIPGLSAALPHIKSGKLRALAIGGTKRSSVLPDVPTVAEVTGVPGYEVAAWFGILAPAGTPPEIVGKLADEIAKATDTPQVKERYASVGAEALLVGPQPFAAQLRAESDKWGKLIKQLDIKSE